MLNMLLACFAACLLILIFALLGDIAQSLRAIGALLSDILIGAPDAQAIDYDVSGDDLEQYFENAALGENRVSINVPDETDWRKHISSVGNLDRSGALIN